MKLVQIAMLLGAMVALGGIIGLSLHPPKSTYASPRLCYNEQAYFKSDVCSKIGKQWPI